MTKRKFLTPDKQNVDDELRNRKIISSNLKYRKSFLLLDFLVNLGFLKAGKGFPNRVGEIGYMVIRVRKVFWNS